MDPLLIEVPEEFETDRLTIRCARPGDGAACNRAIAESIGQLKLWMPWAKTLPTPQETESHARRAFARFHTREDLTYRAWLKGTDTFIVGSGLHRINWEVPKFEIGYWCRTSLCGKGYVTETVSALTRLAFERLHAARLEIRMDSRNQESQRVAERCGFVREGLLRHVDRDSEGELRDMLIYSQIR